MENSLHPELGRSILQKINARGWNLYHSSESVRCGHEEIIRKGPVQDNLMIDERYVLLPIAANPKDPVQVMNKLEEVAVRLERKTPTITIDNQQHPLTGFRFHAADVKIATPEGYHIAYPALLLTLDTLYKV